MFVAALLALPLTHHIVSYMVLVLSMAADAALAAVYEQMEYSYRDDSCDEPVSTEIPNGAGAYPDPLRPNSKRDPPGYQVLMEAASLSPEVVQTTGACAARALLVAPTLRFPRSHYPT